MTAKRLVPFLVVALCALVALSPARPCWRRRRASRRPAALLRAPAFRNLGPARQNGRILHVLVNERQPSTFYLAPATGGLWKTTNNGTTFESVLPDKSAVAIGHAALAPSNPDIVWVGTGDAASGRIPLRGFGVWKSADAGKTWAHMGLTDTRHIGRIAIHPRNPDIVYVAAVGYHFSDSPDRGLYKTADGGKTWAKVLFKGDRVGVVDVVIDPKKPSTVFAVTYDKTAHPLELRRGRAGDRHLQVDRRWEDVAAAGGRAADGQARPERPGHLPEEPRDHVRRDRQPQPAPGLARTAGSRRRAARRQARGRRGRGRSAARSTAPRTAARRG